MRSRSGSPQMDEMRNRYSRLSETTRPKFDNGGYTKFPIRGPDAFKTTRPKK